jgi:hypothetical protein
MSLRKVISRVGRLIINSVLIDVAIILTPGL